MTELIIVGLALTIFMTPLIIGTVWVENTKSGDKFIHWVSKVTKISLED